MSYIKSRQPGNGLQSAEGRLSRSGRQRTLLCLLVAVVGVAISLLLAQMLQKQERRLAAVQFQHDAERRVKAIEQAVTDRLNVVDTIEAFYAGSKLVERIEFSTFSKPLLKKFQGVQILGWAPLVAGADRESYELAVREEGFSDYKITERDDRGRYVPAGKREKYSPVLFVEPFDKYKRIIGFDLRSDPACLAAAERSLATGRQAAAVCSPSGKNSSHERMFFVVTPISETDPRSDHSQTVGFVFGVFDICAVVEEALRPFAPVGIDINIREHVESGKGDTIYLRLSPLRDGEEQTTPSPNSLPPSASATPLVSVFDVVDRHGEIECVPLKCYSSRHRTWGPVLVLLTGLVITALMVGYIFLLTGRSARVRRLVALRTQELRKERHLLRELLDLHEQDRKLISYEIHDGLAQQLTGALMKFQSLEQMFDRNPTGAREVLHESIHLLRDAMAETRRLIGGLRPPVLDESGIVAAVEVLIAGYREGDSPEIELVDNLGPRRFAPPLESTVFRIVQESLTNACRYSRSEKVRVELDLSDERISIDVRDWGVGFDHAEIGDGHFGLRGIRERARLMGGSATIDSAPEQGTRIRVDLPLLPPVEK